MIFSYMQLHRIYLRVPKDVTKFKLKIREILLYNIMTELHTLKMNGGNKTQERFSWRENFLRISMAEMCTGGNE